MQEINFEEAVERILAQDQRFARDAYIFVRESLDFTQRKIGRENHGKVRHVNARELLDGVRQYALQQYGPMSTTLFAEWGISACGDFGEIVFNMVEIGLLAKTETDSRADFRNGYDFVDAFEKPFWPEKRRRAESKSAVR